MAPNDDAIIFINNLEATPKRPNLSLLQRAKMHFSVPPEQLHTRILSSFVPTFFGKKHQKIHIDLLGPLLALLFLFAILYYGHATKLPSAAPKISPAEILLVYSTLMPVLSYLLSWLAQSRISFIEIVSILGYALFGHVLTLLVSLLLYDEKSNFFFFVSLMVFGGLSTLRIVLIFVVLIPKPALRFVICCFLAIFQLLFLISLHFLYMHRTFSYGRRM